MIHQDCNTIYNVYTLSSTRDPLVVRYVGKAVNPHSRLLSHTRPYNLKNNPRYSARWIAKEKQEGYDIIMNVIECWGEERPEREIYWIKKYRELGYPLTNLTDGGEGITGHKFSEESRRNMGKTRIGNRRSGALKRVYQIDNDNNILKEYYNVYDAAEEHEVSSQSIRLCASNRAKGIESYTDSGKIFTYDPSIKVTQTKESRKLESAKACFKAVIVYDYWGNKTQEYDSIKNAAKDLSISAYSIYNGLNNFNRAISKKYRFKYASEDQEIDFEVLNNSIAKKCLQKYRNCVKQSEVGSRVMTNVFSSKSKEEVTEIYLKASRVKRERRLKAGKNNKVAIIDDQGNVVREFDEVSICAEYLNISPDMVYGCLTRARRGKDAKTAGYRVRSVQA